jgi:hypothetical protein
VVTTEQNDYMMQVPVNGADEKSGACCVKPSKSTAIAASGVIDETGAVSKEATTDLLATEEIETKSTAAK